MQYNISSNVHVHQIEIVLEQYSSSDLHTHLVWFSNNSYGMNQFLNAQAVEKTFKPILGGCIDFNMAGWQSP